MFCVYLNQTCCNKKKNLFTTNAAVFYNVIEDQIYCQSDLVYKTLD